MADIPSNLWQHPLQKHVWRPYSQMQTEALPLKVVRTEGVRLTLDDGRTLIDGVSSWWTACHGYNHPHILAAVETQLRQMPHVMFGGLIHEPAIQLSEKLIKIAPQGMNRVFYSDSGSTAVEVAMKMALQYWQNKGKQKKDKFVCFRRGYHGDTFGAMSVSNPDESMHKAFRSNVSKQLVLDIPLDEYGLAEFQEMMQGIGSMAAGVIIEPLMQGAEGMNFYGADVLAAIYAAAKENDMLFIADEVATGFGRTGLMFACNEAGITPDIMCVGKALTGGVVPMAATLTREEIFEGFLSDNPERALMHGPTYMANPLGCAAGIASIELFEQEDRLAQVEAIEQQLCDELAPCKKINSVKEVRVKGAIGVVEMESDTLDKNWLRQRFIDKGVWVRPLKNIIYIMPPLVIDSKDLHRLTQAMLEVITEYSARKDT
ncbi:MAG: adenosylmethionine--8-amino-7-oxononanoate transaminase [Alphaproteobacteria bacterium]|nr:adenosylmethionine--8-amino-7-oxononanoate transaminase [Alphaproteobacteria bacterium]